MTTLRDIRDCFEGVIPSVVATADAEGVPNVSYLSQVHFVDDHHVALSNQFLAKTARNVAQTGRATALVIDGLTGAQHELELDFVASLTSGEVFDRMSAHLRALSTQHGMEKVMRLHAAELYRVASIRTVPVFGAEPPGAPPPRPPGERLATAARVAAAVAEAPDPDAMIDRTLDGLRDAFGFAYVMLFVPAAEGGRLTLLASRGYETAGVGAEVTEGQGVIGIAAETRRPVRLCDVSRGVRMTEAVRRQSAWEDVRTIPLPGLAQPLSQLAAPMVVQGRLRGVLYAEAETRFAFGREDEDAVALIGAQLASGLLNAALVEMRTAAAPSLSPTAAVRDGAAFRVRYHRRDDSLFLDDEYLIKGVPGRLLCYFLQAHLETGRTEFTNREVRLDASLRLPDLKDNLETRLILLRRRLDEKQAPVRLTRPGRGRIGLSLDGAPRLNIAD